MWKFNVDTCVFAFDLEDDAVRRFWIKILQEMWARFSLLSIFYVIDSPRWTPLGSENRVCLKENVHLLENHIKGVKQSRDQLWVWNLRCSEIFVKGFCILKFSMRATCSSPWLDRYHAKFQYLQNVERGLVVGVRVHMSLGWISNSFKFRVFAFWYSGHC